MPDTNGFTVLEWLKSDSQTQAIKQAVSLHIVVADSDLFHATTRREYIWRKLKWLGATPLYKSI